jgi:transposase
MLTLNISKADIELANYERIRNPIETVRKRMDAIYWTSQGYERKAVVAISGVHRNSVKNYVKLYNAGGLEALKRFEYKGFVSVLSGHRVTLEAYFEKHPPRTAREAVAKVKEITGTELSQGEMRRFMHELGMKPLKTGHVPAKADPVAQQLFLEEKLSPLLAMAKAGECHLLFMDAAHFVLLPFVGILWCFARVFIKAAAGRNRINVLGALDAVTLKMETVVNTTYVNAETIAEMLEKLAKRFTQLPIYVVLDNARYQHCDYVKELAKTLGIHLVFLPPYSPNLNLIERVWRYIKKDVLGTHYFDCAKKFHEAIETSLFEINHNHNRMADMKTLITPRFQTFAQNLLA